MNVECEKKRKPKVTARLTEGIRLSSVEFGKAIGGVGGGKSYITIKSLISRQLNLRYLLPPSAPTKEKCQVGE